MQVGFIGTGEIASAMVQGLAGRGHEILVSPRNAVQAERLAAKLPDVRIVENVRIVAEADVVFLCLLADAARDVLPRLPFRANQAVVSVMVDVPLADLTQLCAPATDISLTIPLSAIATGGSMLPVYPASAALDKLFGDTDMVIPVQSERALNAHFGGCAVSAPLIELMRTASSWLANQTGDAQAAEAYVTGIMAGFLRQITTGGADIDSLLRTLATEGGLNDSLKKHMQDAGASAALTQGLDALKPRLGL